MQRDFRAYLRTGVHDIDSAVAVGAHRGLAVYHYAYRANLMACLRDNFARTCAWLGDSEFDAAALRYIDGHPPTSWTISDFGVDFHETLAALYPADPEVEELAWLDWSLRRAFDGPDAVMQDPAGFPGIDWERATLGLAPTLTLRPIVSNCGAIYSALATGAAPPAAAMVAHASALAVWRKEFSPHFRTLSNTEYMTLIAARNGASFGEICSLVAGNAQAEEDAARVAGSYLAGWLSEHIVTGVLAGDTDRY